MSIDDYEDDEELFEFDDDELDFIEEEGDAVDRELMHKMVKMTRKREAQEHEWALEDREKILKEAAKVSGPTFFNPKDLYLPQGENI